MNDQERSELERLKQQQARLQQELSSMSKQLRLLEMRLSQPVSEPTQTQRQASTPAPKPVEPVLRDRIPPPTKPALEPALRTPPPPPPPIPPVIELAPRAAQMVAATPPPGPPVEQFGTGDTQRPAAAAVQPAEKVSFEMRLGTYWLVRIGIVALLTGLVFFGTLAYQNYISKLGPGGKVSLLYAASGILLGAGWWWQRKAAKESLKNYAQVLFAGGLAAAYFTTYAAHHVAQLLVIPDPVIDGLLLLVCAGFMVWFADRRKSEVLALFAVGLAYYTSIITRVGSFTLYSNLVLTTAAVVFLVRNRWAALSFASLIATYAAYAFWRFWYGGAEFHWPSPENPESRLWTGALFLMCYWLVFTIAVFLSKDTKFAGASRVSFLTMNNAAFFALFALTMWQVRAGHFWVFSLSDGAVLLAASELARRLLANEPLARDFYLTQGLLLVTVGFIAKFAGLDLALILAAESVTLLMLGYLRQSKVLRAGAYVAAVLSIGWGMDGMLQSDARGLWLGMGLGALMLWNALWTDRQHAADRRKLVRPQTAYFTVLALLIWLVTTWDNTIRERFPLVLIAEGLLLAGSIYLLQVPEVSLFGQVYVLGAQCFWAFDAFGGHSAPPWWSPVLMTVLSMSCACWWKQQKALNLRSQPGESWDALDKVPILGKNLLILAVANFAVGDAGGWDPGQVIAPAARGFWLPIGLGALLITDTLLARWRTVSKEQAWIRFQPVYSTALALVVWLAVTWHNTSHQVFPLVLAGEGLVLTMSYYALRAREISLLSQGYIVLAQVAWLINSLGSGIKPPWWNPVLLLAIVLFLSHWWQRQAAAAADDLRPGLRVPGPLAVFWQALYALGIIAVLYFWLSAQINAPAWLAVTSLLAVGLTTYGVFTRAWWLAIFGQIFLVVSGVQFAWQLVQNKPDWPLALAPIVVFLALSLATVTWFRQRPDSDWQVSEPLLQIARLYRCVALVMTIGWVWAYIPERERIWVLELLALGVFLWAGWKQNREALAFSAAFTFVALALFWLPLLDVSSVYAPNLAAILVLLAQRQAARQLPDRYPLAPAVHGAVIVIGGASLWLFVTRWVLESANASYLTASWSVLALVLFTSGIAFKERVYRWLGLAVLGIALGRVVAVDVWKLEAAYRVLSFMALGVVLLVLGFIYNKYQEKIKEWL